MHVPDLNHREKSMCIKLDRRETKVSSTCDRFSGSDADYIIYRILNPRVRLSIIMANPEKCLLNRCCCCYSLRTGTLVAGVGAIVSI
ncbi:hypothetical protein GWI33_003981 [Rhynchophorus ferrugineus]|uniref:Uncharacterized protein n=1 Tax=Rhynchophorus ferrugineus TaxID=354439 RepID=A0A834HLT9_RHYFE|nr:hypothetical protein GWI33_003981 [Rhynchophorus ferrugineus]